MDRDQVALIRGAYVTLFDQIAHPDGANYPRTREWIWQVLEHPEESLDKRQQSRGLSLLTDTLLVASLVGVSSTALVGEEQRAVGEANGPDRGSVSVGFLYALALVHPPEPAPDSALDQLGEEVLQQLMRAPLPAPEEKGFWGEVRVLGEALYRRIFSDQSISLDTPEPLLYAMGVGLGPCSRRELWLRAELIRRVISQSVQPAE